MEDNPRLKLSRLVNRLGHHDASSLLGILPVLAAHVAAGGDAQLDAATLAPLAVLR